MLLATVIIPVAKVRHYQCGIYITSEGPLVYAESVRLLTVEGS
jgi:hypothetical protein